MLHDVIAVPFLQGECEQEVLSLTALAMTIGYLAFFGVAREADKGIMASLFQLLMAGQLPIIAYFVITGVMKMPKQTLQLFVLQVIAALPVLAVVHSLKL